MYCEEWEAMVLEWIKEGNNYYGDLGRNPTTPDHPNLPASTASGFCIIAFPLGILDPVQSFHLRYVTEMGNQREQLLPGTYEYRGHNGDYRVKANSLSFDSCSLMLLGPNSGEETVKLVEGEPFTFQFFLYHGRVVHDCIYGSLYRIGD